MSRIEELETGVKEAMLARDAERRDALRLILSSLRSAEKDLQRPLSEGEELQVLQRERKKRIEAAEAFREGGRENQAAKEEAELAILQEFMPAPLSEDELEQIVDDAIAENGGAAVPRNSAATTRMAARTAPQSATIAPITRMWLRPEMNEARATSATCARVAGGAAAITDAASPLESCVAMLCAFGRSLSPATTSLVTRLAKIAPSAAMPVAMPSCRNVLLIPDAMPARSTRTVETAVEASGALTMPMPIPPTMKPGRRVVQSESIEMPLISHIESATRPRPAPSSSRIGTRVESRPAIGAAKNETMLRGRKRTPVSSGDSPSTFCR